MPVSPRPETLHRGRRNGMALAVALAIAAVLASGQPAAQQAGTNVNVLPVLTDDDGNPITPAQDPDIPFKTDYYNQRQLEPSLAASTRNPNHLVAFFNDYRAVDIADDIGLGETTTSNQSLAGLIAKLFRRLTGKTTRPALPPLAAAAEAWVGMSRSYDGGLTWSGALVPGAPFDSSAASMSSPLKGLDAATDPVVMAAPCGYFHVVLMGFTRGGTSKMVVATYQDENNSEGGETIHYKYTTLIETGNNASHGYFLDKPDILVDLVRGNSSDPCAYNIYASYTTFNGLTKDNKFQSKITLARSSNKGVSFTTSKLNQPYNQNQGTALAVDPRPGTPQSGGGGTLYLFWRHFYTPDTILVARSTNFGQTFSKPQEVPSTPLAAFDQPTYSTKNSANAPTDVAFRSNGFPTATVTGSGRVFVAWQERVALNTGNPVAGGSPRIVLMRSTDGGSSWTDTNGMAGQRQAIDMGPRDQEPSAYPPPGFGALPMPRPSGPQVMPKLAFGGGRLLLSYYESRGFVGRDASGEETFLPADLSTTGFIGGIDRVMDLRAALLDPSTGALQGTTQVSRYPIREGANLADGEQLEDVEAVAAPCSPDNPGAPTPCVRRVNRVNYPHSAAGTSPFIGDYIGATPIVSFVPNGAGSWKWALAASDVPYRAFRTIWADNRNLIPPAISTPQLTEWQLYNTPGTGTPSACNAGSRNSDVLTSLVNAELVLNAPTTSKQLGGIQRAFPIYAHNGTSSTKYYRYTFEIGSDIASFSQSSEPLQVVDAMLLPFSGETRVVYVSAIALPTDTVKVRVQEINGITLNYDSDVPPDGVPDTCNPTTGCSGAIVPGGISGSITLNIDPTNPSVGPTAEEYNPLQPNPLQPNPLQPNPLQPNPLQPNPLQPNITASNSALDDATIDDTQIQIKVWSVGNGGNTTAPFVTDIKIDNPEQYEGYYLFQQVIYKVSTHGGLVGCDQSALAKLQILASVPMTSSMLNPLQPNPLQPNPLQPNPLQPNPLQPNATFAAAPPPELGVTHNSHDGTIHAPRARDQVYVAFIAYPIAPAPAAYPIAPANALDVPILDLEKDPPSIAVIPQALNTECLDHPTLCTVPIAFTAPDLKVSAAPTVSPTEVAPGGSLQLSGWTLANEGTAVANSEDGDYTHKAYLSADNQLDAGDTLVGLVATSTGPLAAGATQAFGPVTLTVPNVAPGDYYLLLMVDDEREVSEFDETNNVAAIPLTVEGPNVAPVAQDQAVVTPEDTPVAITLAASDANGDTLSFSIASGPSQGALSGTAPTLTYTPAANYHGPDSFTFTASDGELSSNVATVSIVVTPVNDAPVANPDSATATQNGPAVTINVLANDTDVDGDTLTVTAVTQPAMGTAAIVAPNVTYRPAPNFVGVDTFTYTVSDGKGGTATGTVTVTVDGGANDYGFIGLLDPWKGNSTTTKVGNSFPLLWQYTASPTSVVVVESSGAMPEVRIRGPFNCNQGEVASTLETVAYPGNSGFQYDTKTNTHQFNWQTTGLALGCYNIRIHSETTLQTNGPFRIQLRR